MSSRAVLVAFSFGLAVASRAAGQEALEFTLDEVDAQSARQPKPAVDPKREIAQALGELRWGMSKAELIKLLRTQVRVEFEQRVKAERDILRQDALYQEAKDRAQRISENYVEFNGQKTGWDVSPIRPEFTHGNREAMLVVTSKSSRDMYFFIQGKLWKWFRELTPDAGLAVDPDAMLAGFKRRFGPGKPQRERRGDTGVYPGSSWSDGSTLVTALRRGSEICLIFEDASIIPRLAVLRHSVQPKHGKDKAAAAVDSILLSEAELEARSR